MADAGNSGKHWLRVLHDMQQEMSKEKLNHVLAMPKTHDLQKRSSVPPAKMQGP
jgi:hypothetical protein